MKSPSESGPASPATPASAAPGLAMPGAEPLRQSMQGRFVCPFCGSVNETEQGACVRCTMENTPATRKATKSRIGPWYVLQSRNPAAPGMRFDTLIAFVRKGRVKPRSIVRGPTTHQLWRFAAQVKGLSREFGVCYSCGGAIDPSASLCPLCNRLQDPPANPDALLESPNGGAAPASRAPAYAPHAPRPVYGDHPGVNLAADESEFIHPAAGGGSEDSLAGFSLAGSMAGVTVDPAWARIDTPAGRGRSNGNGAGHASPNHGFSNSVAGSNPGYGNGTQGSSGSSSAQRGAAGAQDSAGSTYAPASARKTEGEGFLSPKDLATAFNLDFSQDANGSRAAGASAATAPTSRNFRPGRPRRSAIGRLLRVLLLLVMICGVLYGAAILIDETFRRESFAWFAKQRTALLGVLSPGKPPSPRGPADAPVPGDTATPADRTERVNPFSSPDASGRFNPPHSTTSAATAPGASSESSESLPAPTTAPVVAAPAREPLENPGGAVVSPPPTSRPAEPARPLAPPTQRPPPVAASPATSGPPAPAVDAASTAEVLRLYRDAISAEQNQNLAGAAAKYRAVKNYPQEMWPADLDLRLRLAEDRIKAAK